MVLSMVVVLVTSDYGSDAGNCSDYRHYAAVLVFFCLHSN